MSEFANTDTELFLEKILKFEDKNINAEHISVPITDAKFGILNLKAAGSTPTQEELDFIFMIDCSGSMSDKCSDGRSKMQHIVHTLKNMILYFKENSSIKAYITIDAFDDRIYKIVERCSVTSENYESILEKVDKIYPRQSTNIELALREVKTNISKIKDANPSHTVVSIFMTDGEATTGSVKHSYLSELVDTSAKNIFIGFGVDHDALLLKAVSNGENSAYYFIDKLENSGLVYGEILYGIVYKLLMDVEITIQNGLIYDFKNNTWVQTIRVGEIASEADKIYHIASSTPQLCAAVLSGKKTLDITDIQINISTQEDTEDLTKYIYRQRTLQHLYIVGDFLKRKKSAESTSFMNFRTQIHITQLPIDLTQEEKTIRETLRVFIQEMKQYMQDNGLNDDKIMKNLCDDIYISYRTFGTRYGAMFNNARQTSQGTQRCYTVSHTPEETATQHLFGNSHISARSLPIPRLQRHNALTYTENDMEILTTNLNDLPPINHVLSDYGDAPYLTPLSTQVMREISCNINNNYEEETQEI
jgi:hypothetical protein